MTYEMTSQKSPWRLPGTRAERPPLPTACDRFDGPRAVQPAGRTALAVAVVCTIADVLLFNSGVIRLVPSRMLPAVASVLLLLPLLLQLMLLVGRVARGRTRRIYFPFTRLDCTMLTMVLAFGAFLGWRQPLGALSIGVLHAVGRSGIALCASFAALVAWAIDLRFSHID